jgi:bifunctional DNase/RNase
LPYALEAGRAMLLAKIIRRLLARTFGGARANWLKLVISIVLLAGAGVGVWQRLESESSRPPTDVSEMMVERLEPTPNKINLVLKEKTGPRRLVLAVGQAEAGSIVQDLNLPYRVDPPVTAYNMTRSITDGLGGKVQRVVVNNVNDTAYFAKIVLATDSHEVAVDAAPSDAIALALRAKAPIYADAAVLDKAGIVSGR